MFSNLKGRDLFLIVLLLTVLVGLGWYFMLYSSLKSQIELQQADLDQKNTTLTLYQTAKNGLPNLRTEVAGLSEKRASFLRALPRNTNIGTVLAEIRTNAQLSGVEVASYNVQPSNSQAGLPAGVAPITIVMGNVTGRFGQLFQFTRTLENMNRFSNISALGLNMSAATSFDPTLSANLSLTIYTFNPDVSQPASAAPAGTPAPAAPATSTTTTGVAQ